MYKNNLKDFMTLNKLHKQEKQFKRDLSKTFLEYLDNLPPNKRIEQMESLLYETEQRNLPTLDRRLSFQERKCLYLASQGKEIKDTANILGLSQRTIKYHRANIFKKLKVSNITAAVFNVSQYKTINYMYDLDFGLDAIQNFQMLLGIQFIAGIHWWKDINGVYQGCNLAMVEALGFNSCNDIIGKNDYQLPWTNQASALVKNDEIVMQGSIQKGKEEMVETKQGNLRTFMVAKTPIRDMKNKIIGTIGNSIDITELKQTRKS